jgi:hypothetical protein
MADDRSANTRQRGLQHAASVIFALVAIVPLLIFAWTLHAVGGLGQPQAQVGLGLALAIALLGFWMFRSLLGRMAEVVRALGAAVEQASRTRPAAGSRVAAVAATVNVAGASAPSGAVMKSQVAAALATSTSTSATSPSAPAAARPPAVAGLGKIRELTEVAQTMDALWYREATAHVGFRVQISVANSRDPIIGTLSEASPDGLILEQPDGPVPIAYGRVTAIDRLT